MAKLRIYGETSGFMELEAPAVSDNSTVSLDEVITTSNIATNIVPAAGEVLQSVSATTGFGGTMQSINSSTKQAVTGLSVTITPKYNNSKMLISGYLHSSATYVMGLAIYKNGSSLITGNTQTNQTGGSENLWTSFNQAISLEVGSCFPYPFMYEDTVSNTNATTYQIYANSGWSGSTNTLYINDRSQDDMRSQSWITVQEIKV